MQQQVVEMKAVTWQKDSHGLFDYETQQLSVEKFQIRDSQKVYRQDQKINVSQVAIPDDANSQYLTTVQKDINNYFIQPKVEPEKVDNDNYLIVRSLKNQQGSQKGYKLEPGDIIKLGRMEYVVIEAKDKNGKVTAATGDPAKEWFEKTLEPITIDKNPTCKICLFETIKEDDPFITPCKCKGTCEFVHFSCLKEWIDSRGQQKQQNGTYTYKWKKLDCEVCQEPFPQKINILDKSYHLAQIHRPECPYLILQSTMQDRKQSKGVYVIQVPDQEPIRLVFFIQIYNTFFFSSTNQGRGHQCDIRISDISVSRLHAFIKYEEGNFIIVDNNSKFGTLVKMIKPFQIQQEKVAVQIGRTVLTFVIKQEPK